MKLIESVDVYHGRTEHRDMKDDIVFFSSNKAFSEDYGEVKAYQITMKNPFHTCQEEHVSQLLERMKTLIDPYDGETYESFEAIENSGLLYHDTWEVFEPHIQQIKSLGYDGMIIYEGGVENFICFHSHQYQLRTN